MKEQIEALQKQLGEYLSKGKAEMEATGVMARETKAALEEVRDALKKVQAQADAIDIKLAERAVTHPAGNEIPWTKSFSEHEGIQRVMRTKEGATFIEFSREQTKQLLRKTTVTEAAVGVATTGVLPIQRIPGITPEARQRLTIRDLLTARPVENLVVDFVRVNTPMAIGSPQTEASDKGENAVTFTSVSAQVRTLATWIPASRQVLDDMSELMNFLQTALPYYVDLEEELQFLNGPGTGVTIYGIIPQAAAFNTALLVAAAGWNRIDILGRAIEQIQAAKELEPSFVVLHPNDWWSIRLTKDGYGRYILGDPQESVGIPVIGSLNGARVAPPRVFGLTPIVTTSIAAGTFLIGSGDPIAIEIRDRMGMQVEIATQHSDFFTKNLIAIRAEKRCCLVTKRPNAFVTGSFSTSPSN